MNPRVVHFYFPISGTLFIPIDSSHKRYIRSPYKEWKKKQYNSKQ